MPELRNISELLAVACVAIVLFVTLNYGPDEPVSKQDRVSRLVEELNVMTTRVERLKNALQAQNTTCLGNYEDLLEQIDETPGHAILLKESAGSKVKIWAVASHEMPEYFTSSFGAFNKRYMSSTCNVYATVKNDGVYSGKWCP